MQINNNKLTAIENHLSRYNFSPSFEEFSILPIKVNEFKMKIMESLLCEKFHELFVWYFNLMFFVCFLTVPYTSNSKANDHRKTSF